MLTGPEGRATGDLDLTAMYVMHDALRRELEPLARVTVRIDEDPRVVLRTAVGWQLFKTSLHAHHTAEDEALWPALRANLAGRPDELALLEAMEAEHGAVDAVIAAIDALLADPGASLDCLGDLVDSLAVGLTGHLKHEEDQAIPLIRAVATPQQWIRFGQVHGQRIGPDAPRLLPWLLDGADEDAVAALLAPLPEPARAAFAAQWQPAYAALSRWSAPR
ncbi:MAG: hemerythrin domain-containing protein [Catenulispora sp.]